MDPNIFGPKGWLPGTRLSGDELPEDLALPQLPDVLCAERLAALLDVAGADLDLLFVRYVPGRSCLTGCAVRAGAGTALVTVKALATAPSEDWLARRRRRLRAKAESGMPFRWLAERRIAVAGFPNDLRLRTLPDLLDEARLRATLREALDAPDLELSPAADGELLEPVSYKPERSFLARAAVSAAQGSTQQLYLRTYRDERAATVHATMRALHAAAAGAGGELALAMPLGHVASTRLLVQSTLGGRPLPDVLEHGDSSATSAAGRALAVLHALPIPGTTPRAVEEPLGAPDATTTALRDVLPWLAERVGRLSDALRARAPDLDDRWLAVLHGDLAPSQVLVDEARTGLVDFDRCLVGDVHADLGSFLARLERNGLERGWSGEFVSRCGEAFVTAYGEGSGRAVDARRTRWHHALGLARMALSALRHLRPGWRSRFDAHLGRAESVVGA